MNMMLAMLCGIVGTSAKLRSAQASRVSAACCVPAQSLEICSHIRWSQENCQPEISESRWESANGQNVSCRLHGSALLDVLLPVLLHYYAVTTL